MEGFKTYRHDSNPKEKELHDKFVKEFEKGVQMEQIALPINERGEPKEFLTDREKQIMVSTIQWLGSPVGQGFLEKCGFEIKKGK